MSEEYSEDEKAALKSAAGIPHMPTDLTYECRMAVSGEGPRAYDWSDKPHRLIYDLCREIEAFSASALPPIKRLEWIVLSNGNHKGRGILRYEYLINRRHNPVYLFSDDTFDAVPFDSLDEAYAAAQADYEQRIRSAFLLTTLSQGEVQN